MQSNSNDGYSNIDQDNVGDVNDDSYIPPDEPMGAQSFGTTVAEQRVGEGFERRNHHTQAVDVDNPGYDSDLAGQLVQPGDESIDVGDDEAEAIATDSERNGDDLSAEEAAVHVIPDRS